MAACAHKIARINGAKRSALRYWSVLMMTLVSGQDRPLGLVLSHGMMWRERVPKCFAAGYLRLLREPSNRPKEVFADFWRLRPPLILLDLRHIWPMLTRKPHSTRITASHGPQRVGSDCVAHLPAARGRSAGHVVYACRGQGSRSGALG